MEKKYNFYLAGPFFNEQQIQLQEIIEELFSSYGKKVFSPRKDAGTLPKDATKKDMYNVFKADLDAIDNCECLFANVSYKDTGTSVEIGYALAKGIPVVLFRSPVMNDTDHVNLMIALACNGKVLQSTPELIEYLKTGVIPDNEFQFEID